MVRRERETMIPTHRHPSDRMCVGDVALLMAQTFMWVAAVYWALFALWVVAG